MFYKNFIAFVVTPSENYVIFCHFWGYVKGFYGNMLYYNLKYEQRVTLYCMIRLEKQVESR